MSFGKGKSNAPATPTALVHIKALAVHDNGNGTFSVELPVRQLSTDENVVVERLLPNLSDKFYELLEKEALLSSTTTIAETQKPKPGY